MKDPNAFAMPGGYIYITQSLVHLCEKNHDELAFVLGHEIGHVVRKHVLNRFITKSTIGMLGHMTPGTGVAGNVIKTLLSNLLSSSYSQDQELEADDFGIRLMCYARYNPTAAEGFMQRLKKVKKEQGTWETYFSTHPEYDLRIRQFREILRK